MNFVPRIFSQFAGGILSDSTYFQCRKCSLKTQKTLKTPKSTGWNVITEEKVLWNGHKDTFITFYSILWPMRWKGGWQSGRNSSTQDTYADELGWVTAKVGTKRPQGKLALGPTLDQEVKTNFLTYSSISLSTHDADIFSWGKTPPDFPRCRGEAFSTNWVTIRLSLCVPQGRKWTLNGPDKSHPSHIKTGAKFSVRTPGRSLQHITIFTKKKKQLARSRFELSGFG